MTDRKNKIQIFHQNVSRGKKFELEEKLGWKDVEAIEKRYEAYTEWQSKSGRIDIRIDEIGGYISIIEIKSTNWDMMKQHRFRPNTLRHARQVLRYIKKEVFDDCLQVCPGIIYEQEPTNKDTRIQVENILNEQGIQVVWRSESEHKK